LLAQADALEVPVTDQSFDDVILMTKARQLHMPVEQAVVNLRDVRKGACALAQNAPSRRDLANGPVAATLFCRLRPPSPRPLALPVETNRTLLIISFFVLAVMDITTKDAKELLEQFAKSPHRSRDGHLNEEGFVELMGGQCEDKEHLKRLFQVIDTHGHGHVDFREYVGGEGKREERRELTRFAQIRALRRRS
jgi:hypothetical protein